MLTNKDKQGLSLLAGVILIVAMVGYYKITTEPPVPDERFCIDPTHANTVIVVDESESTTDQTRAEIAARVMQYLRNDAKDNERISVFTLTSESARELRPKVDICKPKSTGNRFVENVKKIEANTRKMEQQVLQALRPTRSNSPESPLAQVLIDLSLSEYLRGTENTLLVFSDLLENTTKFSLYSCSAETDVIKEFRKSRTGAKVRPQFANTRVKLNVIPRFDIQSDSLKCRDRLWLWFFGDSEGPRASIEVDYLPGGPLK